MESAIGSMLPDRKINLGLDLKGGIHLTMEVDLDKAIDNTMAQFGRDIRASARDEQIPLLRPRVENEKLTFTLVDPEKQAALDEIISENYSETLNVTSVQPQGDRVGYVLSMEPEYREYLAGLTLDQAVKTIRNRIDQFGVAEPDIRKQPRQGRIVVQLPGLEDTERAINIIGQTAQLEFRIVDDNADPAAPPPGREVLPLIAQGPGGGEVERPIVVFDDAALTGEHVTDARVSFDTFNQPYVGLTFSSRGAQLFEQITAENIKNRMAIVLDGKVFSAPVIQDRISGGRASITGNFTLEEARDLAVVLRAGSLPAPVRILEQRTVGASLGQESIDQGVTAALIGFALVIVFMIIYYGFAGFVADTVLLLNIVLIMAGLAGFGATLTLPGIAGIILTIGMAVDANVIIFERIREELRNGLSPRAAVDEGYSRATLTILDANVTTIIAAVVLYEFGTGPIRGFAVTLSLGIIASMFTAIFVSRILFDAWLSRSAKPAKLSI
jgi:preprotein translocase subunit SecD